MTGLSTLLVLLNYALIPRCRDQLYMYVYDNCMIIVLNVYLYCSETSVGNKRKIQSTTIMCIGLTKYSVLVSVLKY